jgi:molecular chaperone HscA
MGRAVGIDLGTTNSLVAVMTADQVTCLSGDDGTTMVPSVVHYAKDGSVVVGRRARDELAPRLPEDTIASAKRFMGCGTDDAEATRRLSSHAIADAVGDGAVVRFAVAGGRRTVTPLEVSAEILRVLKARAEAALGGALEGAVVTVPAYFNDAQRQATRDAGRLAGLEVLRLLNEPTAAALAYGLDQRKEGTFAVFDLGGGTFDISVLALEAGVFEVRSTGGDAALGGDDFDRAIAAHLLARAGLPEDGGADRILVRRVLDLARAAKEALTEEAHTAISLPLPGGDFFTGTLDRDTMEGLVRPVLHRCVVPVRRALKDAGVEAADLSGVILVGGATRMPLVRQLVRELFGREPLTDVDPDEVVARGAAIQAHVLSTEGRKDVLLLDVVPLSLGIETMGGVAEKLIARNTTLPCHATQTFTTYADAQTGFDLHIVQGERELVSDCRSLARFQLGGIPPMPAGMARLEVTLVVNADGILEVSARELVTGNEASVQVKPSYGLTDEEIEKMLRDAQEHAEKDVKARRLADKRAEAQRLLLAVRGAVQVAAELCDDGERAVIAKAASLVEKAISGTSVPALVWALDRLDAASKDLAGRRMNKAFTEGLSGKDIARVEAEVAQAAKKRPSSETLEA